MGQIFENSNLFLKIPWTDVLIFNTKSTMTDFFKTSKQNGPVWKKIVIFDKTGYIIKILIMVHNWLITNKC